MRVLVVEDNAKLADGLTRVFKAGSFHVDVVATGDSAETALSVQTFDLMILDLNLPDQDGLEVLQKIRQQGVDVPVLILTARCDLQNRVSGLDKGADDYMTKPFEVSELEARVRALIRRSKGKSSSRLKYSCLELDLKVNELTADGKAINTSARELSVLRTMLMTKGRIISRGQIIDSLSTFDELVSDNALEQVISRLRKKLAPHQVEIRTARGIGYYLFAQNESEA